MSTSLFNDMRPNVTAMMTAGFGGASRAQQTLLSCMVAAAQTQFGFTRGLMEDMAETFQPNKPVANPVGAAQALLSRVHHRTECAIADMRRINDEMRNGLYDAACLQLSSAGVAAPAAVQKAADAAQVSPPAATTAAPAPAMAAAKR